MIYNWGVYLICLYTINNTGAYDNGDNFEPSYSVSICWAKPNLAREIYTTLSMEKSLRSQKENKSLDNFSPYHKDYNTYVHM